MSETASHQTHHHPSPMKNFFAGGFGGICLVATGHPLDTVKVRIQTMPLPELGVKPIYSGTFDCIRQTFHNEGMKGFYRGMATPLIGITPLYSIAFFGYTLGKRLQTLPTHSHYTPLQIFNAGMLSGIFTTPITAPGERVKCLLQIQASNPKAPIVYKGPVDCAIQLYRTGGIRSVFRGTYATLLRDAPGNGVYFLSYELFKQKLATGSDPTLNALGTLFSGGMAGICYWTVAIPPDVLKSRLQTAPEAKYPRGLRDVFKEILKNEGFAGLYKGSTAVFLRAFPANAACFFGYELAMKLIHFLAPNL